LNIKNLLYYFHIEDKPINEDKKELDSINIKNNEPIIIEYNNNISYKTKLFNKIFVKNNKKKLKIEIEKKRIDLIQEYEFKSKVKIVRIKLFINNGVSELNMYKMFANCFDLISVNGISKLKKIKIINMDKIFYNCISLSSVPDFYDWELEKKKTYLMFYNCISLIYFPYEEKLKIKNYDDSFLGLLITKYFNKEIIYIAEENEGYINLFDNKYKIKDKEEEIKIFEGKEENELIACYKDKNIENENNLIILNKKITKGVKIKLRLINKLKDVNKIIKNEELDLSKWNTNNVINMSYLFYNCSSLKSLPDISKWNTNNVKNMSYLFYNCSSLSSLPDISKWNINNVINMSYLFYNCSSLSSLPDISKWNTNNVINMSFLFYNCSSLSSLPDISKWNTNNVINLNYMFYCKNLKFLPDISQWDTSSIIDMKGLFSDCSSLSSIPDISKWNTNNITDMSNLFLNCSS